MRIRIDRFVTVAAMTMKGISQAIAPLAQTFSLEFRYTALPVRIESVAVDGENRPPRSRKALLGGGSKWRSRSAIIFDREEPLFVPEKCIESIVPAG